MEFRSTDAADATRSGSRPLEEQAQKLEALRRALVDGEASGIAGPLDIEKIKRHAREEAGLAPS